jgi:hypothetical protein
VAGLLQRVGGAGRGDRAHRRRDLLFPDRVGADLGELLEVVAGGADLLDEVGDLAGAERVEAGDELVDRVE